MRLLVLFPNRLALIGLMFSFVQGKADTPIRPRRFCGYTRAVEVLLLTNAHRAKAVAFPTRFSEYPEGAAKALLHSRRVLPLESGLCGAV